MKHFLLFSLLFCCTVAFGGKRIYLKKNSAGVSIQINNALDSVDLVGGGKAKILAGDTIALKGDYGAVKIFNLIQGTKGNEVVFVNEGQVVVKDVGGKSPVVIVGKYIKFLFNLNPSTPYGLQITCSQPDTCIAKAFTLLGNGINSSDYEMAGVEISLANIGLHENPPTGDTANKKMSNIYIHDCYFHDFIAKKTDSSSSEAIYFGYSGAASYYSSPRFYNLRVENCRFENLDGDGAQIKVAQAIVKNCSFYNTGRALLSGQGEGVVFGAFTYGTIDGCTFDKCRQHAIMHKGTDTTYITNNVFKNISNKDSTNDIVRFDATTDTEKLTKLVVYMHDNQFINDTIGRSLIYNSSKISNEDTSYFYQNCITNCKWSSIWPKFLLTTKDKLTECNPLRDINVNVCGTILYNNPSWNDWSVGTGIATSFTNIVSDTFHYADGGASTVSAVLSYSKGVADFGTYSTSLAPDSVIRSASHSSSPTRTLTINGLSTSKTYTIELYASNKVSGTDTTNKTIFSIGTLADTIVTANNLNHKTIFTSLAPDSTGKLVITSKRIGTWTYLNGFKITENNGSGARIAQPAVVRAQQEEIKVAPEIKSAFTLYPNPASDRFTLSLANALKGSLTISIFDIGGRSQKTLTATKDQQTFQKTILLNNLASGTYLVQVQIGNWKETKMFVKQ